MRTIEKNDGLILVGLLVAGQAIFGAKMLEARADDDLRDLTKARISAILTQGSPTTAADTSETSEILKSPVVIRATKIPVRTSASHGSNVVFFLYSGMSVQFTEIAEVNGSTWGKFELAETNFWINLTANANAREVKETPRGYKIVIDKSDRTLKLLKGNGSNWLVEKTFPAGLGGIAGTNLSPKTKEWDGLTPEGIYYASWKNPASFFGRNSKGGALGSLYISYPNAHDAWNALRRGEASTETYKRIALAVERNQTPPKNTGLGNEVMIHGGGASDWTAGCVALDDPDMEYLWKTVPEGTPIEIHQ